MQCSNCRTISSYRVCGIGAYNAYDAFLRKAASGSGDVNFARVASTSIAQGAKEKCLPVLQANQDVFSNSSHLQILLVYYTYTKRNTCHIISGVLAVYIDMCGKKVDRATELQVP